MLRHTQVDCVRNLMAHAQKPDFVFRRNRRVHLKWRGRQFSRLLASRGVRISGSNVGYTMFRGIVKSTGYPLHSPVSPSLLLPCVTVCHHISTGLYFPSLLFLAPYSARARGRYGTKNTMEPRTDRVSPQAVHNMVH